MAKEDYVFAKGVEQGLELGMERGFDKGYTLMSHLVAILIKDNKLADLEKASTDLAYRDSLSAEYNL